MPILSCYVDERTLAILKRHSVTSGRTVEELAEGAIESEAIASLPRGYPGGQQHFEGRDDRAATEQRYGLREKDLQ